MDSSPSLACQDCRDGYHPSRKGIKRPQSVTLKNKLGLAPLVHLMLPILIQKPGLGHTLPMILGTGILFLSNKLQGAHKVAGRESPRNTTVRTVDGHAQTWDRFMWLNLGYRHLSTWAPLCWEQKNDSKQNQANCTRNMEWIPQEQRSHSVILRDSFHLAGWAIVPWAFPEERGQSAS